MASLEVRIVLALHRSGGAFSRDLATVCGVAEDNEEFCQALAKLVREHDVNRYHLSASRSDNMTPAYVLSL